ncbi:MAG: 50S ribosomal protein L3, large subunit ribosomal protein L3 [Candidatus Gottesmanbacteria bacterium GW2011_GWA2_43_14]|uniref:Large ribosomal subunit protein uL3 n=1 Tax=Candidatus Gottesmanbacteria bacterium GW2011_GWA2_43_14 TaxID=1618443 RepID=A0A0G1FLW2_9BACT|nr:MAG: 50S ribosomal protein L3, large subunit ribosomal protein L3 [Candidatus Gottesmanbacteria bacterium GW2011_GWA2_43_14]
MFKAILGSKINQSQLFDKEGNRLAVTHITAGPCQVVSVKTEETDGYRAVVIGFGTKRIKLLTKAQMGNFKKAGLDKIPPRFLTEIETGRELTGEAKPGQSYNVADVFKEGDTVQVTGTSKGKGFAGVVKRHGFAGGPRTHGQSDRERAPGSIGQTTTPGRVYKGKRMAGRMGTDRVTIKNLKVVKIDAEKNILTVGGLVPGGRNSLLLIRKTGD